MADWGGDFTDGKRKILVDHRPSTVIDRPNGLGSAHPCKIELLRIRRGDAGGAADDGRRRLGRDVVAEGGVSGLARHANHAG